MKAIFNLGKAKEKKIPKHLSSKERGTLFGDQFSSWICSHPSLPCQIPIWVLFPPTLKIMVSQRPAIHAKQIKITICIRQIVRKKPFHENAIQTQYYLMSTLGCKASMFPCVFIETIKQHTSSFFSISFERRFDLESSLELFAAECENQDLQI